MDVQRSAKIKLHRFRKAVIVHKKCGTLFVFCKSELKQESQIQKEKGKKTKEI